MGAMNVDIKIDGLDGLHKRLGTASATLDASLRPALRQSGQIMRDEAKHLAVGHILPNSVRMTTVYSGLEVMVFSVAQTALSIEEGRRVGSRPSLKNTLNWMNRAGVVAPEAAAAGAVQNVKTHKVSTRGKKSIRSQTISRAQRSLAWKIAQAIGVTGTKALPFIIPAAQHKRDEVQRLIQTATQSALRKIAKG